MFTWEEAGLLRSMLLVVKWTAIVGVAVVAALAAAMLAGCPARVTAAALRTVTR